MKKEPQKRPTAVVKKRQKSQPENTQPVKTSEKVVPASLVLPNIDVDEADVTKARKRTNSAISALSIGWLGFIVLLGGFGSWAVFSEISGAVIANGQIAVERNRQVVQHPDGGVVSEISIEEGDIVQSGQVLLRLDDTLLRSNYEIVRSEYWEIQARIARLTAERDGAEAIDIAQDLQTQADRDPAVAEVVSGQQRLFEARNESRTRQIEQLERRKEQINAQVDGIKAQQTSLNIQLGFIQEELSAQQDLLEKGLAQVSRVLGLQREQARLQGQVGDFLAEEAELSGRITELDIEILRIDTQVREQAITEIRDLQFRATEKAQQMLSLEEQLSRMDIRAPVSGIIYGLAVFGERAVISPAEPVLYLVPQDRPLVIRSEVPAIHVDQVYPGQEVTLRFSAFNSRTTPEVFGTVDQISADAFVNETTGATFYAAEITLNQGEVERLGDNIILPGMPVEAYIKTEDRSPIVYLVRPVLDYFNRAFRET